jgi:hypothetical protein
MEIWPLTQGTLYQRTIAVANSAGPIAYAGTEPLSFLVWGGQDQAPALTLTPAWLTAASGTVNVTFTADQVASLAVGVYRTLLQLTDGLGVRNAYEGAIEVAPDPGSAAVYTTDISLNDLTLYCPAIGDLNRNSGYLNGFLGPRHRAQTKMWEFILDNYRPQPGRARRYLSADQTGAGTFLSYSDGPNGALAPTMAQLRGYLALGGLRLTDRIKEAEACYAASVVCLSLPTSQGWNELGGQFRSRALAGFDMSVVEIDPTGGTNYTLRIDRDCTFLT